MHYEAVFFDFDGTLVDSTATKENAFFQLFPKTESHVRIIDQVLRSNPDGSRYEVIPCIVDSMREEGMDVTTFEDVPDLIELYAQTVLYEVACAPEKTGATETLQRLASNGVATYLCSNTPHKALAQLVDAREWTPYFTCVAGYPERKEDFVRKQLQRSGTAANQAIFVGDGVSDREAAQRSGVEFFPIIGRDDLAAVTLKLGIAADV